MRINFTDWLVLQESRPDLIGDMARAYIAEGCKSNFDMQYLKDRQASELAMSVFVLAQKEYNIYDKNAHPIPRNSPRF